MESVKDKVNRVLMLHLPGAEPELTDSAWAADAEDTSAHTVGGWVIWDGFNGLDQLQRQDKVWDLLDRELTKKERQQVRSLLTMTPDEVSDWAHRPTGSK